MRGNAGGYGMGAPAYGGGISDASQETNTLDAIRQHTSKIEDLLDSIAEPVKPYVTRLCFPVLDLIAVAEREKTEILLAIWLTCLGL